MLTFYDLNKKKQSSANIVQNIVQFLNKKLLKQLSFQVKGLFSLDFQLV